MSLTQEEKKALWSTADIGLIMLTEENKVLVLEYYSNFPESLLGDIMAKQVIRHVKSIFAKYSTPAIKKSDSGLQFCNLLMRIRYIKSKEATGIHPVVKRTCLLGTIESYNFFMLKETNF